MPYATAFLIFCCACTVLAFVRHPIFGLHFYLAVTYVFPPSRWWGAYFPSLRWSLIAAAVTILAVLFSRNKLREKPPWLTSVPARVMVSYAAWMWIQSPWVLDGDTHYIGTVLFTKSVVACWFVYRIVDTKEHLRDMLLTHLLGCTVLGIYGFLAGRSGGRLDGVGGPGLDDANTLAMYFATAVVVGIGLVITQTGWRRWVSLACLAITGNGLVLTNTRGAFVGLIGGALLMVLFRTTVNRRMFWVLALIGIVGLSVIVDQKFVDRMWTIRDVTDYSEDTDASARSRVALLQGQIEMFLKYPMGTGHRGTETLSPQYLEERWLSTDEKTGESARSSHNTFMTALVEQGIPGALLFITVALWTIIAILRLRLQEVRRPDSDLTTLASSVCGALTVIFIAGNTADFLLAEVQFWMLGAFAAVLHLTNIAGASERATASELSPIHRRVA